MGLNADLFAVTSSALTAEQRRLVTATEIEAVIGNTSDDTLLATLADRACDAAARYCNLAAEAAKPPTFASETLSATWWATAQSRGCRLWLPWRVPVTAIGSVVEDGVTLTADTHYRWDGVALVRLEDDEPIEWDCGKIVVAYTAGWTVSGGSANVPEAVKAALIEQVKFAYKGRARDPALRSRSIPDVYTASYNVVGGDAMGDSGLLPQLEAALTPFRLIAVG